MKAPSLSAVRETLRETAPGITIRKEDCGEYRVTFTQEAIAAAFPAMTRAERIEKAEALASYDSDICAVYETGKAMFRTGLNPATAENEAPAATEAKAEGRESMWKEIARGLAPLADERNAMAARLAAIAEALDSNASPHSRLAAIRAAVES